MAPFALLLPLALLLSSCATLAPTHPGEPIRIVVVGDSTVQTYTDDRGIWGWGQVIDAHFDDAVEVVNLAKSGRSTKTFMAEGLWQKTLDQHGDFILIQFGHNDSHAKDRPESTDADTDYADNLRRYVDEARQGGARPILITPMHRRRFEDDGRVTQELLPYADAMKRVAREKRVPCVDLHASSGSLFAQLGDAGSAYLSCAPKDRTHFSEAGARAMARLVAEGLAQEVRPLRRRIHIPRETKDQ